MCWFCITTLTVHVVSDLFSNNRDFNFFEEEIVQYFETPFEKQTKTKQNRKQRNKKQTKLAGFFSITMFYCPKYIPGINGPISYPPTHTHTHTHERTHARTHPLVRMGNWLQFVAVKTEASVAFLSVVFKKSSVRQRQCFFFSFLFFFLAFPFRCKKMVPFWSISFIRYSQFLDVAAVVVKAITTATFLESLKKEGKEKTRHSA